MFHTWLHCYIVLNHANVILFHTMKQNAILFHSMRQNAILFHSMRQNAILFHSMRQNAILFHFVHFSIERLRGYFRLLRRISLLTNDILNQIKALKHFKAP